MPRQCSVLAHWFPSFRVHFYSACLYMYGFTLRSVYNGLLLLSGFPLFISCSLVVHSACVVTFTLRSVYCLVSLWSRSFVVYSACLYGNTLCSSTAVFLLVFSVRTVYSACLYGNTLLCVMRCGLGPCRLQCVRVFATTHCVPSTALFLLGPSVRVTCRLHWSLRHTAFRLLRCHSLASLQPHGICWEQEMKASMNEKKRQLWDSMRGRETTNRERNGPQCFELAINIENGRTIVHCVALSQANVETSWIAVLVETKNW